MDVYQLLANQSKVSPNQLITKLLDIIFLVYIKQKNKILQKGIQISYQMNQYLKNIIIENNFFKMRVVSSRSIIFIVTRPCIYQSCLLLPSTGCSHRPVRGYRWFVQYCHSTGHPQ